MANKKTKNKLDMNIDAYVGVFFKWFFISVFIISCLILYFTVYNPKQRIAIKRAVKAYKLIQNESLKLYKNQGYLFNENTQGLDEYCTAIANAIGKRKYNCTYGTIGAESANFKIKKSKIEIYGLEKPAYNLQGSIVKDFIVDINGAKGENRTGIDRFPLRVYSTGALAGRITPVNCSLNDTKDFEFDYSSACGMGGEEINFLATNIPFGFSVVQIGGKDGKTKEITHDVSFLRADCAAMGGDLIAYDYCEAKQYYWLAACYDEFPCSIELVEDK